MDCSGARRKRLAERNRAALSERRPANQSKAVPWTNGGGANEHMNAVEIEEAVSELAVAPFDRVRVSVRLSWLRLATRKRPSSACAKASPMRRTFPAACFSETTSISRPANPARSATTLESTARKPKDRLGQGQVHLRDRWRQRLRRRTSSAAKRRMRLSRLRPTFRLFPAAGRHLDRQARSRTTRSTSRRPDGSTSSMSSC